MLTPYYNPEVTTPVRPQWPGVLSFVRPSPRQEFYYDTTSPNPGSLIPPWVTGETSLHQCL